MNHFYPKRTIMFHQSPYRCSYLEHTSLWLPICYSQRRWVLSSGTIVKGKKKLVFLRKRKEPEKSIKASSSSLLYISAVFISPKILFLDDNKGATSIAILTIQLSLPSCVHIKLPFHSQFLDFLFAISAWELFHLLREKILSSKINYN